MEEKEDSPILRALLSSDKQPILRALLSSDKQRKKYKRSNFETLNSESS
jgi:hypothetical protein